MLKFVSRGVCYINIVCLYLILFCIGSLRLIDGANRFKWKMIVLRALGCDCVVTANGLYGSCVR